MSTAFNPVPQPRLRLHRAALAALLAFALVCVQSLGLWHRLVHPGPGQLAGMDAMQSAVASTAPPSTLSTKLFAQHHGDPDCQFFDHASLGDGIGAAGAVAVALAIAPRLIVTGHGLFIARWHALFQARGPPSVR
jgi:hypothetical protein